MRKMTLIAFVLLVGLAEAGDAPAAPPSIEYGTTRQSSENIKTPGGVFVGVDKGIEWQGVKVYLSMTSDLLCIDTATGKALWHHEVSAFWNRLAIIELETTPGKKTWVVELRPFKDEDHDQKLVERYELKTGVKIESPDARPSGKLISPLRQIYGGDGVSKHFVALLSTPDSYAAATARLDGNRDPELRLEALEDRAPTAGDGLAPHQQKGQPVDFSKEVVLIYCLGDTANSTGVHEVESFEDDKRILVRTYQSGFQTMGNAWYSRQCSRFVLPRREGKTYVIEHNTQSYIGGPPIWTEVLRVEKLGDVKGETAKIPGSPKPNIMPANFNRVIQHFKTVPKRDEHGWDDSSFFGKYDYDFYRDLAGNVVMHGPFRKFESTEPKEITLIEGSYLDGQMHGEWRFRNDARGRFGMWKDDAKRTTPAFTVTYNRGELHGPSIVYNQHGMKVAVGQFDHGKAHGVWTMYHDNGKKSWEGTYDHGLLNGVETSYFETGAKREERHFVMGQATGAYSRWYENGQPAVQGEFIAGETPPPYPGGIERSGFSWNSVEMLEFPGYRHGTWVRFARDGKELWRGAFDHGTGALTEYSDNGKKWYEARFVGGQRRGEFKEWSEAGWLAKKTVVKDDGSMSVETYFENGTKQSLEEWATDRVEEDGVRRIWNADGTLKTECIYKNFSPWSGQHVDGYGTMTTYADGKKLKKQEKR